MSRYSISGNEIVIRFTANPSTEIRTLIRNAGFKCVKNAEDNVWEWRAERTQENEDVAKDAVLISNGKKVNNQRSHSNGTFKNVSSSDGEGLIKMFTLNDIISLPVSSEVKEKTIINTVKKFNYTLQNSIVRRKQIELICDLYMGDLAKNCIVDYLRKHCVNGLQIIDYDEVRTDNFTEHDPWDFCINRNDLRVEVKSSTPPLKENGEMESNEELLNGYGDKKGRKEPKDIKIIAKKTLKQKEVQPEEFDCFVFPQVYFRCRVPDDRDLTQAELNRLRVTPTALQEIVDLQRFDSPLFFGWATKTDVMFFRDRLVKNQWTYGNAVYWRCPLRLSRTLEELVDFANKTIIR